MPRSTIQTKRERFDDFNARGGKFRIAVTNVCNLDCFFCHNEGMPNPRRLHVVRDMMDTEQLLEIANAYCRLGGRQLNITGGEPLAWRGLASFLDRLERGATRVVLNSNAVLGSRLLGRPKIANLDGILISLHTTRQDHFRDQLGGRDVRVVMDNIVALAPMYDVEINFSLGPYNKDEFVNVLAFAQEHGIRLKAIALVRHDHQADAYGGDWVDPAWLSTVLQSVGAELEGQRDALGGRIATWRTAAAPIVIKNVAQGRLRTTYCDGCNAKDKCGEGIYGVRVGVDGMWKPCLLRHDGFRSVDRERSYEDQILDLIDRMIGEPEAAHFQTGIPA